MPSSSGFRIGRVFGIDIVIHSSWLVILALFAISLGDLFSGAKPQNGKSFPGGAWPWLFGLVTAIVLFLTLLAHELAHSFVAKRNGIPIRRITLFLFGGVAEMSEDVESAQTEFKMAVAGPLVTFLFAAIFYLFYHLAMKNGAGPILTEPLLLICAFSLFIGIFNILPGFPLDGGRVLRSLLWWRTGNLEKATRVASRAGQVIGVILVIFGFFLITGTTQWISGVWPVIIGIFIFQLARTSYRQTLMRIAASGVNASAIVFSQIPLIAYDTPLSTVTNYFFANYRLPALPVKDEAGRIEGVVTIEDLNNVSGAELDFLDARRIEKPLSQVQIVPPDTPLEHLFKTMLSGEKFALVMDGGEFLGIITREELLRFIELRMKMLGKS
ncbi:MAG: site-2 protease family protein [Actinomycetota bacterium]|nr:site-2 protease family protein [Actinomycetota bacterium]